MGQIIPITDVGYEDAFERDGACFAFMGFHGKKAIIVPAIFQKDGMYHLTRQSLDFRVPQDMCVRIVGRMSAI